MEYQKITKLLDTASDVPKFLIILIIHKIDTNQVNK